MPAPRTHAPTQFVLRGLILAVPLAATVLAAAACSSSGSGSSAASPSAAPSTTSAAPSTTSPASPIAAPSSGGTGTAIQTAQTSLGTVLTDGKGITVYLFEADTGTTSTCYAACAAAWPPVLTTGAPVAGPGAKASLLGTTKRTDGTTQATYAGHPLYHFRASTQPGQVNGQGVNGFGAHWDAVRPSGAQAG